MLLRNVVITKSAKAHIEQIHTFIAQDNRLYADKVCDTILWFISWMVSIFPNLWKKISEQWFLEIVEPNFRYKIVYIDTWKDIIITAIYKYQNTKNII